MNFPQTPGQPDFINPPHPSAPPPTPGPNNYSPIPHPADNTASGQQPASSAVSQTDRLEYLYLTLKDIMSKPYTFNPQLMEDVKSNMTNMSLHRIKCLRLMTTGKDPEPIPESQIHFIYPDRQDLMMSPQEEVDLIRRGRDGFGKSDSKEKEILSFLEHGYWEMPNK